MIDKSTQLVLDALGRAVAEPTAVPLHGSKTAPGLFAKTSLAKQAAQHCKDEGYLQVVGAETKGKTVYEVCAITEKGLAYLLSQVSPKQVLEELVRALEARQAQVGELTAVARQMQASLDALRATTEKVLQEVGNGPLTVNSTNGVATHHGGRENGSLTHTPSLATAESWVTAIMSHLAHWQTSGASEDCPLPELCRHARQATPTLTIGQFHDSLRRLHDQEQIYLHPWTGPLYEIPEPPYALLIGHEIAYYASLRGA